ncbi:MAG: ATPase P [Deltaproteobacteria bacterium]|nr:ATPase P [Deltaproteobacteria bacterium]
MKGMLKLEIPGFGRVEIRQVVMDLNGTLGTEGVPDTGTVDRLRRLSESLDLIVLTADTHGRAKDLPTDFGMRVERLEPGREDEQKSAFVERVGCDKTVTLGNGNNDVVMLRNARVGICVIGEEGASRRAVEAADIVVHHVHQALDLLLKPKRLLATLRW